MANRPLKHLDAKIEGSSARETFDVFDEIAREKISDLEYNFSKLEPGLSQEAKDALLACFRHVAFLDNDADYYHDLESALSEEKQYQKEQYPGRISSFNGTPVFLSDSSTDGILLNNGPGNVLTRRFFGMNTGKYALQVLNPIEGNAYPIAVPTDFSSIHVSIAPSPMEILIQLWQYDAAENVYKIVKLSNWGQSVLMTFESADNLFLAVNARADRSNGKFLEEPSNVSVLFAKEGYPKLSAEIKNTAAKIYDDYSLNDLRSMLVVKYLKSEKDYDVVTDYDISGSLTSAKSSITVSYKGLTSTFDVDVIIGRPLQSSDIESHIGYSNFAVDENGNISSSAVSGFSILALNASVKHIRYVPSFNQADSRHDVPLWTAFYKNSNGTFICNDQKSIYLFTSNGNAYTAVKDNTLGKMVINNYNSFTANGKKDVVLKNNELTVTEVDAPNANLTVSTANRIAFWSDTKQSSCPKNVRVYND